MENKKLKIVKTQEELIKGAKDVAHKLNSVFSGQDALWMTVMIGGIMFSMEVAKHINFKIKYDFIHVISYDGFNKVQTPQINYPGEEDFKDQNIILVDDLIDSGESIKYLIKYLRKFNPKSISIVAMFTKQTNYDDRIIEYVAFPEYPNGFLIGYGLDFKSYYRNFPYVAIIENEEE